MSDQDIRQGICQFLSQWEEQPQAIEPLLEISLRHSETEFNQVQRALATSLAAGVIRWHKRLDHYIDTLLTRKKRVQPELRNILRLALFELEFPMSKARPEYAVVSEAVNLAKTLTPGREGFINGILRSFLRHKSGELLPADDNQPQNMAVRHSLPVWLVKKWQADFGQPATRTLCLKANQFQGTTFRVNCRKITGNNFLERFKLEDKTELKLEKGKYGKNVLHTLKSAPLLHSEWFKEGFISVQDEGAQLIVELLNPQPGEIILDACAAPGGKSAYMAELNDDKCTIIAADSEPERLKKISATSTRLGLNSITPVAVDLTRSLPANLPQTYDRILVDAPCSGLGVICRRPDLRWRKSLKEIDGLSKIQLQILSNCSKYLKVGGRLIYATCTTCRDENQDVVEKFLTHNQNFRLLRQEEIESENLRKLINRNNFFETSFITDAQMDGFFAAPIIRTS